MLGVLRHLASPSPKVLEKTDTLEGWCSLIKRGVNGTSHHVSEQHLDRYVDEFAFHDNNREISRRTEHCYRPKEGRRQAVDLQLVGIWGPRFAGRWCREAAGRAHIRQDCHPSLVLLFPTW